MKKSLLADSVAAEMSDIMESDSHKSTFTPVIKTAAKKKEDKDADKKSDKKDKEKAKKDDKKKKDDKFKAFKSKKKADLIEACMNLSKISEMLDNYGLEKSAHVVLGSASLLVSEASFDAEDDNDADDKEDEKDEDKADANDAEIEVSDADDCAMDDDKEDESKKADSHSADDVSGEELRALLSELGLSGGHDESEEPKQELDEDYADDYEDCYSMPKEASYRAEISKIAAAKSKPKSEFIFPKDHKKVTDKKDHFPLDTIGRGRNALSQASKFKKCPSWFKGTLEELVSTVQKAVKKKYKEIETTDKSKKPGKG